jgi:hypothetical protein
LDTTFPYRTLLLLFCKVFCWPHRVVNKVFSFRHKWTFNSQIEISPIFFGTISDLASFFIGHVWRHRPLAALLEFVLRITRAFHSSRSSSGGGGGGVVGGVNFIAVQTTKADS